MLEQVIPKTRIEIIDFIVNHFETNPRSINEDGDSFYNGPNGEHCAFAILCENPEELPEGFIRFGIARIKPEFDGQSKEFYSGIQLLHDRDYYWKKTPEGNKLTQEGINEVKKMKKRYK